MGSAICSAGTARPSSPGGAGTARRAGAPGDGGRGRAVALGLSRWLERAELSLVGCGDGELAAGRGRYREWYRSSRSTGGDQRPAAPLRVGSLGATGGPGGHLVKRNGAGPSSNRLRYRLSPLRWKRPGNGLAAAGYLPLSAQRRGLRTGGSRAVLGRVPASSGPVDGSYRTRSCDYQSELGPRLDLAFWHLCAGILRRMAGPPAPRPPARL